MYDEHDIEIRLRELEKDMKNCRMWIFIICLSNFTETLLEFLESLV